MDKFLRDEFEKVMPKGMTKLKISRSVYEKALTNVFNYGVLSSLDNIAYLLKDETIEDLNIFKGELHIHCQKKLQAIGGQRANAMANIEWLMGHFKTVKEEEL